MNVQNIMQEFKAFAMKGNVIDLAVAVVIGAAFSKIVSSLVDTIIMPMLGILLGGINFSGYTLRVGDSVIAYGVFVQSVVDFVIVAFVIFLVVKALNKAQRLTSGAAPVDTKPAEPPEEIRLLREIRDSLNTRP